jgi:tetratricopeptide (TPR) repeat protein
MKLLTKSLTSLLLITLAIGQSLAQVTLPRTPSPGAVASQSVGISTITVKYSRPSVKNRKVWGELVPYGWNVQGFGAGNSAPWRAGANENTTITFSHEAKVEGNSVPAGTYSLFFVINQDNSGEIVLSKNSRSWGSFFYNQAEDQMRAKIQVRDVPNFSELLTYDFINLTKNSSELVLNWEKKQFPVKIEFAVDAIVMANAKEELRSTTGFNVQGPISAARYSLTNNIDLEQGLKWIDQALATAPTNFNALQVKSGILTKMGKAADAEKMMKDAMANATEPEINGYGYQLLAQNENDKAIEVFLTNTQRFPKSANAWDSLGEGYAIKNDKENAVKCFKKSLSLNPPAATKANSEKFLKQFGAI